VLLQNLAREDASPKRPGAASALRRRRAGAGVGGLAAAFHLSKADLEWFNGKPSLFSSRGEAILKVVVYADRKRSTCSVSSGWLLGKATIPLDLKGAEAKPMVLHRSWISIGKTTVKRRGCGHRSGGGGADRLPALGDAAAARRVDDGGGSAGQPARVAVQGEWRCTATSRGCGRAQVQCEGPGGGGGGTGWKILGCDHGDGWEELEYSFWGGNLEAIVAIEYYLEDEIF
jgi:hypothetical protein